MSGSIAFLGASTGTGLAVLKHSLAAGRQCVALLRKPARLTKVINPNTTPNLQIVEGNAHDKVVVSKLLQTAAGTLVDEVVFTIGAAPSLKTGIDDAHVCEKGIKNVLACITDLRNKGVFGNPHIVVMSTTGMSRFGRDVPILAAPFYHILLRIPHADKRKMEDSLAESGESFTVVRASLLTNGESDTPIRVGIEDHKTGVESRAIGYTISRQDTGKWIAKNIVLKRNPAYVNKTVTVTY